MDLSEAVYHQQKRNADSLRRKLRFPIAHGQNLPPSVDLRPWMTAIEDQSDMDSCVANAIAGALEYLYRRWTGQVRDVSRLFIDFNARVVNLDWAKQDHYVINIDDPRDTFDTRRRPAIRALQQYGFCAESSWPYDKNLYMHIPPRQVYDEAAHRSIIPLQVPINITSVKTCLARQIPVLVGIVLSTDPKDHNQGFVQIPDKLPDAGLHACLVVGYDDRIQHFIIRNSWGTQWGDKGYFYVPYQYLVDQRLVATSDTFWAIPQIVPRRMERRGYFNYPNFTEYHPPQMLPLIQKSYEEQRRKYRDRRRKYFHQ